MDGQPPEDLALKDSPEPPMLTSSKSESPAPQTKAEELQECLADPPQREEQEMENEEEMTEEKESKKKVRHGRAKSKRKRTQQSLALADEQAAAAAAFTFMRKRRQDLTLGAKIKVLEMMEKGPKITQGQIAAAFHVSQSQVSRIMKNKDSIMAQWKRFATPDRKRCRVGKAGALEQKLIDWYKEAKKENLPITGPILMEKAKSIGNEMGIEFKPSAGWLGRWKDRNGVTLRGFEDREGTLSATKLANHWRRYMFPKATKDFSPENVWIVYETVLAYNALPEHLVHGAVNGNDKVTVLLACNLAGTKRKPPVIFGNNSEAVNPNSLPTPLVHQPDSAVTLRFFSSWLKDWDRELHTERKKIVVFMSKVPHHPQNPQVFNMNITFFPVNTSTVLQPFQMGIIHVFKALYRYQQLKYIMARTQATEIIGLGSMFNQNILSAHALSVSIVEAVFMVYKAWRHVSPETIVKGVVKAGMSKDVDALNVCDQVHPPPGISQEDFEALVSMDEGLDVTEQVEHQSETSAIESELTAIGDAQFPNQVNIYRNTTSGHADVSEAVYACQILRLYLQRQGGRLCDEFSKIESAVHLDMILDARPDLRNTIYHQPDPLHDPSSVHSLEAHHVALEQKTEYLQKIQNELHQQKIQKEMKKVTHTPVTSQNPNSSLTTSPQDVRTDLHSHMLGIQRSALLSQDLPRQETQRQEMHHPIQHHHFMRQDMLRPEYRQDIHQDRSRGSLIESRPFRNELRNDGKNYSMTPNNPTGEELHHTMNIDHDMQHQPDERLSNAGMPCYVLTDPLHYREAVA